MSVLLFGFGLIVVFGRRHAVLVLFAVFLVFVACRSTDHLFGFLFFSFFFLFIGSGSAMKPPGHS